MNNKIIWIATIIAICISCASCINIITIPKKGNGNITTSERIVSTFQKINVSGSATVRFHISQEYRVVVTVDENLAEYVEIVTRGNTLNIGTKSGSYSFTKFVVDVYAPTVIGVSVSGSGSFENLDKITVSTFESSVSGSGNIKGTVESKKFSARISGSGRITVAGNSQDTDIHISGSGRFIGSEFVTNNASARISGSGNAEIHVTDNLRASISGSGSINYRGNPIIDSSISGSGRVRNIN
jgi:hypothetical protein